jgi:hypothetical protein
MIAFLQDVQSQCIELENRKFDSRSKEFIRQTFYIAFDKFFHAFWSLPETNSSCRDFFLTMRIRHANEIRIVAESDNLKSLKSCLIRQMYDIYEGFRNYLLESKKL